MVNLVLGWGPDIGHRRKNNQPPILALQPLYTYDVSMELGVQRWLGASTSSH
jgi:hypothetical protein